MEKIDIEKLDIPIDALTVKRADPHIKMLAEKINEIIEEITMQLRPESIHCHFHDCPCHTPQSKERKCENLKCGRKLDKSNKDNFCHNAHCEYKIAPKEEEWEIEFDKLCTGKSGNMTWAIENTHLKSFIKKEIEKARVSEDKEKYNAGWIEGWRECKIALLKEVRERIEKAHHKFASVENRNVMFNYILSIIKEIE